MIKNKLDEAYKLATSGEYENALQKCNYLTKKFPSEMTEILRTQSHIYAHKKDIVEALNCRLKILDTEDYDIQDYYFAASYSIELHNYSNAIDFTDSGIGLSNKLGSSYFISELRMLKAYAEYMLQDKGSVLSTLDDVDDDFELYIEGAGWITKKTLLGKL